MLTEDVFKSVFTQNHKDLVSVILDGNYQNWCNILLTTMLFFISGQLVCSDPIEGTAFCVYLELGSERRLK